MFLPSCLVSSLINNNHSLTSSSKMFSLIWLCFDCFVLKMTEITHITRNTIYWIQLIKKKDVEWKRKVAPIKCDFTFVIRRSSSVRSHYPTCQLEKRWNNKTNKSLLSIDQRADLKRERDSFRRRALLLRFRTLTGCY